MPIATAEDWAKQNNERFYHNQQHRPSPLRAS